PGWAPTRIGSGRPTSCWWRPSPLRGERTDPDPVRTEPAAPRFLRTLESAMALDALELRRVLSRYPTGVTVVATRHVPSGVCGLTVNAFTSVSLEPPLVLVCVDRSANTHACIEA